VLGEHSTTQLGDASLVAMIAEDRDRAIAEAELCVRYRRRAYLYGLKHLGDAAAAEDLVQDVLVTVLERARAGAVEEPERLGSFVLGTCRMHAITRKRNLARRTRILTIYEDPRTEGATSEMAAGALADLPRVRDCLTTLTDRDRTVLLLSFYAELDAKELGRELGIEASHVRVIRHRALGRLQTCVNGSEEDA